MAPLVRYDEQYSTDLVGTLEAYLETNCNMNATVTAIHAHRHTVAYRLERAKELGLKAYRIIEPRLAAVGSSPAALARRWRGNAASRAADRSVAEV